MYLKSKMNFLGQGIQKLTTWIEHTDKHDWTHYYATMWVAEISTTLTYLWNIGVVKETEYNWRHWIHSVLGVSWQHNQRYWMLNSINKRTFKSNVRPQDEPLRPAVLAETLYLYPQTFKILQRQQVSKGISNVHRKQSSHNALWSVTAHTQHYTRDGNDSTNTHISNANIIIMVYMCTLRLGWRILVGSINCEYMKQN